MYRSIAFRLLFLTAFSGIFLFSDNAYSQKKKPKKEKIEKKEVIEITTAKGSFTSDYFIYATHIPPGIDLLHLRCSPYRCYAIAVTLKNGQYPQDLFYDMYDPFHYIRSQKIDGKDSGDGIRTAGQVCGVT